MSVQIAVDPYLSFVLFFDLLHQALDSHYFRVKKRLGVDPLAVEVHASDRISIVSDDNTVWVHAGNKDEGVKASKILCFTGVWSNKVINTAKNLWSRTLSRVDPRGYQDYLIFLAGISISWNHNFVYWQTWKCSSNFWALIVNQLLWIINKKLLLKLILFNHVENILILFLFLQDVWNQLFGHQSFFFIMDFL